MRAERPYVPYFDLLRVVAIFTVVAVHLSAQHWPDVDVHSRAWFAFNLYCSLGKWSVPIFVMISGALFLGHETDVHTILKKNVLRIAVVFIFWSGVYALIGLVFRHYTPIGTLMQFFQGHYHMWFLFMIAGLYLIVPLLQKFTCEESLTRYFLLLAFLFTFLLPQMSLFCSFFSPQLGNLINTVTMYTYLYFPLGLTVYFVGGYYLSRREFSRREELVLYAAGIAGLIFSVFGSLAYSRTQGAASDLFYTYNSLNNLLASVSIFVFARQHLNFPRMGDRARSVLRRLSKYSFGVYLVHPMVIELLQHFGIDTFSCNAFFSVPLLAVIVFAVSLAISAALNRLPFFKRFV